MHSQIHLKELSYLVGMKIRSSERQLPSIQCFGTLPVLMPMLTPAMTILIVLLVCVAAADQVSINRYDRIFLDER